MMNRYLCLLFLIVGGVLSGCRSKDSNTSLLAEKGGTVAMKTYHMGRFALDVPSNMRQAVQAHEIRYVAVNEYKYPEGVNIDKARKEMWSE